MVEKLTFERANHLLRCEEGVLYWRISKRGTVRGTRAGNRHADGCVQVMVDRHNYKAHRLVWLLAHGEWPTGEIDHVNGKRDDNRIENLRVVSRSVNMQNLRAAHLDNSTGMLGVSPFKGKFRARIVLHGNSHPLGSFDTPEEAHAAYIKAKRVVHEGNVL